MHYCGLLRIVKREKGVRIYAVHKHKAIPCGAAERRARIDSLVDVVVRIYASLLGPNLSYYLSQAAAYLMRMSETLNGIDLRMKALSQL